MPSFHDTTSSAAPPENVWKLLYDPARFPDWWAGIGTVEVRDAGSYTMYPDGYPDFPMAQLLDTQHDQHQWLRHGEPHAQQHQRKRGP